MSRLRSVLATFLIVIPSCGSPQPDLFVQCTRPDTWVIHDGKADTIQVCIRGRITTRGRRVAEIELDLYNGGADVTRFWASARPPHVEFSFVNESGKLLWQTPDTQPRSMILSLLSLAPDQTLPLRMSDDIGSVALDEHSRVRARMQLNHASFETSLIRLSRIR